MNKKYVIGGIIAVMVLAGAWYLGSPLFIDNVVSEKMPEGADETSLQGTFTDADDFHRASGQAKLIETGSEDVLRLESFEVTNGPDLYVYLATDTEASDFVELGRLKGNVGDQNYAIPEGTDLERYDTVLIWCKMFSVLFGSAELQTA